MRSQRDCADQTVRITTAVILLAIAVGLILVALDWLL
jgi:preprotein translocase subunit SecE